MKILRALTGSLSALLISTTGAAEQAKPSLPSCVPVQELSYVAENVPKHYTELSDGSYIIHAMRDNAGRVLEDRTLILSISNTEFAKGNRQIDIYIRDTSSADKEEWYTVSTLDKDAGCGSYGSWIKGFPEPGEPMNEATSNAKLKKAIHDIYILTSKKAK